MKYLIYISLIIVTLSCSKEIEVDLGNYETKIVVDGWIETNSKAHVILTKSSAYFTTYDSASIRNLFLNTAKITLSCNDGQSEILTLYKQDEFFPPFVYKSVSIVGEENKSYTLSIETGDKIITAETTIPTKPDIESVRMSLLSDTTTTINATINDDVSENNYYFNQILVRHYDSLFHASKNALYNDNQANGGLIESEVKRSTQPDPLNIYGIDTNRNIPSDEYYYTDTVEVKISAIDKESYTVLQSLYLDEYNSGNPFAFVNQQTVTNVDGGIGRWTGMASRTYLVYLKE